MGSNETKETLYVGKLKRSSGERFPAGQKILECEPKPWDEVINWMNSMIDIWDNRSMGDWLVNGGIREVTDGK